MFHSFVTKNGLTMGAFTSRQNTRNEETDLLSNQAYRYPTKSGKKYRSCSVEKSKMYS